MKSADFISRSWHRVLEIVLKKNFPLLEFLITFVYLMISWFKGELHQIGAHSSENKTSGYNIAMSSNEIVKFPVNRITLHTAEAEKDE